LILAQNFPSSITNEAATFALKDRLIPESEVTNVAADLLPTLSQPMLMIAHGAEPLPM
jgi:hypothetical protein